jgi:predicted DNA-binding transcriptional regulator YafY
LRIGFDRSEKTYYLEGSAGGPHGKPEELAALFLAWRAAGRVKDSEREKELANAVARAAGVGEGLESEKWLKVRGKALRLSSGEAKLNAVIFGVVVGAVLRQRELRFRYRSQFDRRTRDRRARPYQLVESEGCWYVVGLDPDRGETRIFALPRISAPKMLDQEFKIPSKFRPRDYFGTSLGIWGTSMDGEQREIRIELEGYAARLAAERRWHPSQKIEPLDDEGERVALCFRAVLSHTLTRLILSFGARATVLEPDELKEEVHREIREMAKRVRRGG